jgi:hypothetical protein
MPSPPAPLDWIRYIHNYRTSTSKVSKSDQENSILILTKAYSMVSRTFMSRIQMLTDKQGGSVNPSNIAVFPWVFSRASNLPYISGDNGVVWATSTGS